MSRGWHVVVALLMTLTVFSGFQGNVQGQAPEEIGRYVRLGSSGVLTEDDARNTQSGIVVQAPSLSSHVKVDKEWLDARLGAWATQVAFALDANGRIVVEDDRLDVAPLEVGSDAVFTFGSQGSIEFTERPCGFP